MPQHLWNLTHRGRLYCQFLATHFNKIPIQFQTWLLTCSLNNIHLKELTPGPWFNIKMLSCQYRKSHCGDKMVTRSFYLHNGISYAGKISSLYWIGPLGVISFVTPLNDSVKYFYSHFYQNTHFDIKKHIRKYSRKYYFYLVKWNINTHFLSIVQHKHFLWEAYLKQKYKKVVKKITWNEVYLKNNNYHFTLKV